jgi:hypothetical protein
MKNMNNKTLVIIISVLLVSNLALLGMYMVRGNEAAKEKKVEKSPSDYMVRELQLNEQQATQFKTMWEMIKEKNRPVYDSLRSQREILYSYLRTEPQPGSQIDAAATAISGYEKQLVLNNYEHFRRVRAILDQAQQVKLDTLINKMGKRIGRRR